jgi:uncharacterized protein (TIGR00369 family)
MELSQLQGFFAASPFMRGLGVVATSIGEGRVGAELAIGEHLFQHTGQVHAGVMATLADHCMGSAAQTLAPAGHWAITAELKTSQLRPARGLMLQCEAWVVKPGRRLSFTEAEVWATQAGGERVLVMKASATMALVPQESTS